MRGLGCIFWVVTASTCSGIDAKGGIIIKGNGGMTSLDRENEKQGLKARLEWPRGHN